MTAVKDERSGLWVRGETKDAEDLREPLSRYGVLGAGEGSVVLDLGAHVGGAALRFLQDGARRVICVEPDPGSATLLARNFRGNDRVELVRAGVRKAGTSGTRMEFYPHLHRPTMSASYPRRSAPDAMVVKAVTVPELLRRYGPTHVKVDIEGAEYDALDGVTFPRRVQGLLIELHLHRKGWDRRARDLLRDLRAQGFRARPAVKIGGDGWPRLAVLKR